MRELNFESQQQIIDYATMTTQTVRCEKEINEIESKDLQLTIWKRFEDAKKARKERGIKTSGIICTFHAILDSKERNINIQDVKYDQHRNDYAEVLGLHFQKAKQTNKDYVWVLLTDKFFTPAINNLEKEIADGNICLIRSDINTQHLMFDRALLNYNLCKAICMEANILFLDGDAFIMNSIEQIWNIDSDVILTYREQTQAGNIMPINEGVIFCKKGKESVDFFEDYLRAYLILAEDMNLRAYYKKSIKRWRGGQLSLNAVRNNSFLVREKKYSISELSCHKFNCFPKIYNPINPGSKFIIHIKGKDKNFDVIKNTL